MTVSGLRTTGLLLHPYDVNMEGGGLNLALLFFSPGRLVLCSASGYSLAAGVKRKYMQCCRSLSYMPETNICHFHRYEFIFRNKMSLRALTRSQRMYLQNFIAIGWAVSEEIGHKVFRA